MNEINLLKSLPQNKKNVSARESAKTDEHIKISREYGEMYFDGPREYGYGGYRYDGRWQPVAKDIIKYYNLKSGSKVLDVGCAKGFLVKDLVNEGIDAYGLDISDYAIRNCESEVIGRLQVGTADNLPFPDNSFDVVISITTLHNLDREDFIVAIKEIERISKVGIFITLDAYRNEEERLAMEAWNLTALTVMQVDEWKTFFKEIGYTGDYYWFMP